MLAGIGEFNGNSKQIDTLKSRCIVINLKRKMLSEEAATFDDEAKERCVELGRQAAAWCAEHAAGLRTHALTCLNGSTTVKRIAGGCCSNSRMRPAVGGLRLLGLPRRPQTAAPRTRAKG